MVRLEHEFFARHTLEVACDLLGRVLVRLRKGERLSRPTVEVETCVGAAE